jgi:hypothetical protein
MLWRSMFRLLSCVALCCTMAPTAMAEGTSDLQGEARQLGEQALELYNQQHWQDAYDKFAEADQIFHAPTLVLYMARSKSNMGKLLEARELYRQLLREAVRPNAPPQFRDAKDVAFSELEAVEKRIPAVLVRLKGDASVRANLSIDDRSISRKVAQRPVELDPGSHTIVVSAEGLEPVSEKVELPDNDTVVNVELTIGKIATPAPRVVVRPDDEQGPSYVPAAVAFSLGGAGLIVGAITGGLALAAASDIKSRCVDGHCPPEDQAAGDEATVLAHVSTAGFAVGGAGVLVGIILAAVPPGGSSDEVAVSLGPTSAALRVRF